MNWTTKSSLHKKMEYQRTQWHSTSRIPGRTRILEKKSRAKKVETFEGYLKKTMDTMACDISLPKGSTMEEIRNQDTSGHQRSQKFGKNCLQNKKKLPDPMAQKSLKTNTKKPEKKDHHQI